MDPTLLDTPPEKPLTTGQVQGIRLPMDQIERIREAGGPLAEVPDLSNMQRALVAAVEVDGTIVAYWPVWRAVHAEPVWVAEAYRKSPVVIKALLAELEKALDEMGDPVAFAIIGETDILTSGRYAMRLGFERVPGDLFFLMRQPGVEPEKV